LIVGKKELEEQKRLASLDKGMEIHAEAWSGEIRHLKMALTVALHYLNLPLRNSSQS
jgi:hypothetical protein